MQFRGPWFSSKSVILARKLCYGLKVQPTITGNQHASRKSTTKYIYSTFWPKGTSDSQIWFNSVLHMYITLHVHVLIFPKYCVLHNWENLTLAFSPCLKVFRISDSLCLRPPSWPGAYCFPVVRLSVTKFVQAISPSQVEGFQPYCTHVFSTRHRWTD